MLKRCVETVLKITEYQNYEIIIVDNGSNEQEACTYLDAIEAKFDEIGGRIRVLRHPGEFNYAGDEQSRRCASMRRATISAC